MYVKDYLPAVLRKDLTDHEFLVYGLYSLAFEIIGQNGLRLQKF